MDETEITIVCFRPDQIPVPELNLASRPRVRKCWGCQVPVLVGSNTWAKAKASHPTATLRVVCHDCADDMIAHAERGEAQWHVPPEDAELAPHLPIGGPGSNTLSEVISQLRRIRGYPG